MMKTKNCISYIPLENFEILLDIFNNGNFVNELLEVPEECMDEIDAFISLNFDYKEGIVFLYELPIDFQNRFVNKEYFLKAKRLSSGTWFDNPECITYGGPSKIENKEQLNRWILFNKKRLFQYAYAKIKLAKRLEKDYGNNQSFILKG